MPELKLNRGEVVRLEGTLSLHIKKGKVSISGGLRGVGEKVVIPRAKSVPLDAEEDSIVEYTVGEGGQVERLKERTIPREWDELVAYVASKRHKRIAVMGDVDVGKTFLTTYLGNELLEQGSKVAAIDTDVGQSDIGPPSTIGMGLFERPVALLQEIQTRAMYFVGSMSPSGHMLEFVVGMKKLLEKGLRQADVVIVNTPGWISGGPGRALQLSALELLEPDLVVAIQRERELEHLLTCLPAEKVRRVSASKWVRPRSHDERSSLRSMVLGKYFEGAGRLSLDLRKVRLERCYYRTGTPIDPKDLGVDKQVSHAEQLPEGLLIVVKRGLSQATLRKLEMKFKQVKVIAEGSERGLLVGLVDASNELLGIGVAEEIDYAEGRMKVLTPVLDAEKIAAVQFGSIKVRPSGEEIETIRRGSF